MVLSSKEIREKFLDFFKKRGHVTVPSSSLIASDPSVLLTTAGVQQFKPYYTGQLDSQKDFGSSRVVSIQKCFRTTDIDEVGDETHLTFFEMLGNFCFNDYWKKEAIKWALEFLEGELKIDHSRISATYFSGDKDLDVGSDGVSLSELNIYFKQDKITAHGRADNFWGPTGNEGPCGPTVELYIDGIEVWNLVFNEYYCQQDGKLRPLERRGVDTGMGLERLTSVVQGVSNIFETDLLKPLMLNENRVLADHARGVSFLIADGVRPSNKDAGYIVRRLMRRMIVKSEELAIKDLFKKVFDAYGSFYKELNLATVIFVFEEESIRFGKTMKNGLRELNKLSMVDITSAFKLFESYGLPYEIIKDLGGEKAKNLKREDFDREFKKHQEISKAGAEKKFGGHGLILDTGELKAGNEEELKKVTRLHTATHLLQQALRDVLGPEVQQRGSDITVERTRFDFSFPRKLTAEEIKKVEEVVNGKIKENLPVGFKEMSKEEAMKTGALFFFKEKYPEKVKVYFIGNPSTGSGRAYSAEFCGGPHVTHTGEIGEFKIVKEEAVGAGVRRIRGVVN